MMIDREAEVAIRQTLAHIAANWPGGAVYLDLERSAGRVAYLQAETGV